MTSENLHLYDNDSSSWQPIATKGDIDSLKQRLTNDENTILYVGESIVNHKNDESNPHKVTKVQVGLGNVDNTSDSNKPISTATQIALNNKADKDKINELESILEGAIEAMYGEDAPKKDLLINLGSFDYANNKWLDTTSNNLHADLVGSSALYLSIDGYIKGESSGLGAGNFYYEVTYKSSEVMGGAPRVFSDGSSNAGGKKFELFYIESDQLHYGIRDGTNYESGLLFDGLTEWLGDVFNVKMKRVGSTIACTLKNLTKDLTKTATVTNSFNFSSTQIFALNRGYIHNTIDYSWVGKVTYYDFKCGTDENNIIYDFTFSENGGNYIINRVNGELFEVVNPQWNDGGLVHKNLQYGFTNEATYGTKVVPVYTGTPNTDAFCSIAYLGDGICLAGKRSTIDREGIWRSTDHGKTWSSVGEITGYTGHHTYFFGHDGNGVVITGTGDEGNPCIMRSTDYGATWTVVLSATNIKDLAGATSTTGVRSAFSPFYMGDGRWIYNLRNDQTKVYMLESLDNGLSWHVLQNTGLNSSSRKMFRGSNGTIIYPAFIQERAIYVSRDNGYTFQKKFTAPTNVNPFAGTVEIERGTYLVGTYGGGTNPIKILKTTDDGNTWREVFSTTAVVSPQTYFREIIQPYRGLLIAFGCAGESYQSNRTMRAFYSYDDGETWVDKGNPYTTLNGGLNAVYQTAKVEEGVYIMATQPDSTILRSYLPNTKIPVSRTNDNKDVLGHPLTNPPSTNGHNGAETKIRFPLDNKITSVDTERLLWNGASMRTLSASELLSTYKNSTNGIQLAVSDSKNKLLVYKSPITNKFIQAGIDSYLNS